MAKDFRSDVEFNNNVNVNGTLTASTNTSYMGDIGIGTSSVQAPLHINKTASVGAVFQFTGISSDGSSDTANGIGLYLTHNGSNNRQFVIASTQSLTGVRFLNNAIDGYNNGSRADLVLGTETNGVTVGSGNNFPSKYFAVSNYGGTVGKVVAIFQGASAQSGDLTRWVDGSGSNLIVISSGGNLTASVGTTTLGTTKLSSASVGGFQVFAGNNTSAFMALGASALPNYYTLAGANYSVAIGYQTQQYIAAGAGGGNISIGNYNFVASAGNPSDNIVIGNYAFGGENVGVNNLTGNGNTIIGVSAFANASGTNSTNTAIGNYAMYNYTIGPTNGNTSIGYGTLNNLTTGTRNTVLGANSGKIISNGSYNLILGNNISVSTGSTSGVVLIGNDSAGNQAINTGNNQIILGTASHTTIILGAASVGGNSITTDNLIRGINNRRSNSIETFTRNFSATPPVGTSSTSFFTFFTATDNINFSSITFVANTAGAGVSFFRLGIYSVSNSDQYASTMTLVARTASITSAFTANTASTMVLDTTGGYSSSYSLIKGSRYAIGYLQIATTMSTIAGYTPLSALHALPPRISGGSAAQRELSTSYSASLLTGTSVAHWFRLS